jgi:hypothetical protein
VRRGRKCLRKGEEETESMGSMVFHSIKLPKSYTNQQKTAPSEENMLR